VLYKVTSHDTVVAAVRPALLKHGIVIVPSVKRHKLDKGMTIATVEVHFINIDDPADRIEVQFFGYGIDRQDKGPGKAISYATRYAILKVFLLETGDDPENDDLEPVGETITEIQLINLREICEGYGFQPDEKLKAMAEAVFKVKKIEDLPAKFFETAKSSLAKRYKEATDGTAV